MVMLLQALLVAAPPAFVAGFLLALWIFNPERKIQMITADFQAQIDRLNAAAAGAAEHEKAAVDAAVAAATAQAAQDHADNLAGVTAAADAVVAAVGG